jgi:hypothetical protein
MPCDGEKARKQALSSLFPYRLGKGFLQLVYRLSQRLSQAGKRAVWNGFTGLVGGFLLAISNRGI